MTLEGQFRLAGFYTTRWVEAPSVEATEKIGLEMLRSELSFSEEEKQRAPDARIYFDEIVEVPSDTKFPPKFGLAWFDMEEG